MKLIGIGMLVAGAAVVCWGTAPPGQFLRTFALCVGIIVGVAGFFVTLTGFVENR